MKRLRHRETRKKIAVVNKDGCSCCHLPFAENFKYSSLLLSRDLDVMICWWCYLGWYDAGLTDPTELAAWSKKKRQVAGGVIAETRYGASVAAQSQEE